MSDPPPPDEHLPGPDELLAQAQLAVRSGKAPEWPATPPLDASPLQLRIYLTAALGLVLGYHVGRVERHGPYGSDSCVIEVITPTGRRAIRFDAIDHIADPKVLRRTVYAQLAGVTLMRPIKAPEAFDVFTVALRLATVVEHATHLEDTLDVLTEYAVAGERVILPFATPDDRYDSLARLKARSPFNRVSAQKYVRGDLDPVDRWTVIVAAELDRTWVRKGELLTYLRHVLGLPAAPSRQWDAKVREAGGAVDTQAADRRDRGPGRGGGMPGGRRHELKLYLLPEPVVAVL